MISQLFTWLSGAIQASALVAIFASFVWGVLSILLSPCHLSSIPLIIGFINEQGEINTKKAFRLSLIFAIGILLTIGILGVITASLGRMMGDLGSWGNYVVAGIFFIMGLHLLEVINLSWNNISIQTNKKGYWAALILGLIFGIALGPCTFAYMAPMLGIVFNVASSKLLYAIILLLAFAFGHCFVIVLAGTLFERVQAYLNWSEKLHRGVILKKICGVLVLIGGLYLIYTAK